MKKGFTLVELLATIVILGIVILIAIPSYNVISNNIKRKQNENKISYIETQAGKYVTESGLYSDIDQAYISVQTLLQAGYIDGDNKNGDKVLDAYGNDITCYQIEVDFDKSKPEPKFIDEFVKNEEGICIYNAYKTSTLSEDSKITIENNRTFWVKEDVLLKLDIVDEDLNNRRDQAIVKIDWNTVNDSKNYDQTQDNWYTIGWLDNVANFNNTTEYKNAYLVKTNKIMADTKFKISLIVNYIDDAGKKINEALTTYLIVRIDKENPTVTASVDSNWTKENKKIYITGNDKQGSGLNHFCIFDTETAGVCNPGSDNYIEVIGEKGNKGETLRPRGTYYIYAIDNVGNVSETPARVVVDYIDTTKPTCVYENQNTVWKKGTQTITIGCDDGENGSGCITRTYKVTFDSAGIATSRTNLPSAYIITDYAGNKETCLGPVDVYLDNVPPVVTFGTNGDTTYRKSHSSKVTVADEQNGTVKNLKYLWASSNTASAQNGTAFTNGATISKNDGTGNFYLCIYSEDGIGNSATTCSNVFRFDNQPPTINVFVTGKIGTAAISDNVGLAGYALTMSSQTPTSWNAISGTSVAKSYTATEPNTFYYHAIDTLGNTSTQSFVIPNSAFCAYENGYVWDFSYTKTIEKFTVPCSGKYKLEVWGAKGGTGAHGPNSGGGNGGYAGGNIEYSKDEELYIVVGGAGGSNGSGFGGQGDVPGGYNGGHTGHHSGNTNGDNNTGSGGGWTHMSKTNTLYGSTSSYNLYIATSGGNGGTAYRRWNDEGQDRSSGSPGAAGGGNPYFYYSMTDTTSTVGANSGNGKARITLVESMADSGPVPTCDYGNVGDVWTFTYTGKEESWSIPCNGIYEVTVKGGLGGVSAYKFESNGACHYNGNSGCSQQYIASGKVVTVFNLNRGDAVKYKVGGQGGSGCQGCGCGSNSQAGGWNGGSKGSGSAGGSGGHTDLYINNTRVLEARGGDSNQAGYGCYNQGNNVSGGGSNYVNTAYTGYLSTTASLTKADESQGLVKFVLIAIK